MPNGSVLQVHGLEDSSRSKERADGCVRRRSAVPRLLFLGFASLLFLFVLISADPFGKNAFGRIGFSGESAPPGVPACGFETVNRGDWISINTLVVLFSVTVAALIYAIGNVLPPERRERFRGMVRYEIIEAFLSIIIIIILIVFASLSCQVGSSLLGFNKVNNYYDTFNFADNYVGTLLFRNGLSLVSNLYTVSIQYTIVSNIFYYGAEDVIGLVGLRNLVPFYPGFIYITFSSAISQLLGAYSNLFTGFYETLLIAAFGGLFILFLLLPIIEAAALTVVAPLAMIMRSLAFMGPQLRKTSNLFLAMAIGFYFVLPLMIAFDAYIASCLNIVIQGMPSISCNYPYSSTYLKGYAYSLPIDSSSIFSSTSLPANSSAAPGFMSGISLPVSFFDSAIFANLNQFISVLFTSPNVASHYGEEVASYLFLGIVLTAIDIAVTVGFVAGISKGLDAISSRFGTGPFWGS